MPDRLTHTPVHKDLQNPDYVAWRRFLDDCESWDEERAWNHQLAELRRVIGHALSATEAYPRLYAGLPATIEEPADLQRLPMCTKAEMRDNLAAFAAKDVPGDYITTGGSSGVPFGFYRDRPAFAKELASKAHLYSRLGWKEGDRQFVLRGVVIDSDDHTQLLADMCELRCSSYHLVEEQMEAYRQLAWAYRPDWVKCYPSSGYIFSRFLNESGRPFPPVRGVLCASENLYDYQKQVMGEAFQARVFSHYGHYELAVLAGFCESADTYHVLPQYGYAELLRDGRPVTIPGEMGEVVATSFLMNATPFIRYRTGDVAVLAGYGCDACGRKVQVWSRIEGREQELAITGTGRPISMAAINMHDTIFDPIRQFQFHQREAGRIVFNYMPRGDTSEEAVERMRVGLERKFGNDMAVEMCRVDEIRPSLRGKHTFLVQELPVTLTGTAG